MQKWTVFYSQYYLLGNSSMWVNETRKFRVLFFLNFARTKYNHKKTYGIVPEIPNDGSPACGAWKVNLS